MPAKAIILNVVPVWRCNNNCNNQKVINMSVLFLAHVYKFWSDSRDSKNRVTTLDHSPQNKRLFVLNPYFISDLKAYTLPSGATGSIFRYSDNIGDRREGPSTIICDKTVSQIIAYADTAPNSTAITLPIYPHAEQWGTPKFPLRTPVDTTIRWASIAYADRYNPDPENKSWVVYDRGSFKRVRVLTNLALEDIRDLVTGGSTSSTFSTVAGDFDNGV